ncbi:hypothetical protein TCELL_0738 [Thermogladius calderae 1633]|uniref:Uncharacterized protein n=1 Tax=Thermogladius calderae (strain DSM 22663 / VKM B-2946 / 1633) TaxID=1184251 RepID=I3TEH4_THEC1|nr:hypothetical protein [Thermogladius calderae]AFK51162.1 hypothetical protein TCELL_0738 [Thermogladius calderae 1633]
MPRVTIIRLEETRGSAAEYLNYLASLTSDPCPSVFNTWGSSYIWFSGGRPREHHEQVYESIKSRYPRASLASVVRSRPLAAQLLAWVKASTGTGFYFDESPVDEYNLVYLPVSAFVESIANSSPFEKRYLSDVIASNLKSLVVQVGGIYLEIGEGIAGVLPRDVVEYFIELAGLPNVMVGSHVDFCRALGEAVKPSSRPPG